MAGGKYLQQKPPKKIGGGKHNNNQNDPFDIQDQEPEEDGKKKKGKAGKVILIVLIVLLLLIIVGAVAAILYTNTLMNMMSRPQDMETVATLSEEELAELRGEMPDELPTMPTETTSPEETWPEVVSDQNITNIMFIGNAARGGEEERFSDSNMLVSINRETKTVTITSIIRDLRVTIPAYANHSQGFNRINHVYHLGSYYTGHKEDSMKLMALAIEKNFGVHVDYTIEVDMYILEDVINLMGGVTVDLSEDEVKYMKGNYPYMQKLKAGTATLDGYQAVCYARMRKVGNGDWDRTERQREVIMSLFSNLKSMGIMDIHGLFTQVMPLIITDMTNEQITNLAWEMIPMLKDLSIVSQRIPFDGTWWSTDLDPDGVHNYVIDCNLSVNGQRLRESLGLVTE